MPPPVHARGAGRAVRRPHRLRQPRHRRRRSGPGCSRTDELPAGRGRGPRRRPTATASTASCADLVETSAGPAADPAVRAGLPRARRAPRLHVRRGLPARRAPRTSTRRRCGCCASCSATSWSTPTELPPEYHRSPGRPADPRRRLHRRHDGPVRPAHVRAALPSPGLAPGVAPGSSVARIRQEDIEAVKERTDIVQLVGQYLTLKSSGHDSLSGHLSVPPGEDRVVQRVAVQGRLLLLRLRQGRRRHHVPARARDAQLRRGDRTARGHGGRPAPLRGRLARRAAGRRAAQGPLPGERGRRRAVPRACSTEAARPTSARAYATERGLTADAIETFEIGYAPDLPRLPAAAALGSARPVAATCCSRRASRRAATTGRSATGSAGG